LGNPVSLFKGVSSGVEDFFYEPYKGLARGPKDFAKGIQEGTVSLVKNSMGGVFNATTGITDSIGKGIAQATLDPGFQAKRRARRRETSKNMVDGIMNGFASMGSGISDGFTGVITMPMEGKRKRGAAGIFSGLGKGLVGLITKPISGATDGVTQIMEGVGNQLTQYDMQEIRQMRLPRALALNGAVVPYDARAAFGQTLVRKLAERSSKASRILVNFPEKTQTKQLVLFCSTRTSTSWISCRFPSRTLCC